MSRDDADNSIHPDILATCQEPLSSVKPSHRPLHTQVTVLLEERAILLQELAGLRQGKESQAEILAAGLRRDVDYLKTQLDASEATRRRVVGEASKLQHRCESLEGLVVVVREHKSAAEESHRKADDLAAQLAACQESLSEQKADVARLNRLSVDERRQHSEELFLLRRTLKAAEEDLQLLTSQLDGVRGEKRTVDVERTRLLDERRELKEQLSNALADRQRLSSELDVEKSLGKALRRKLEEGQARADLMTAEHARGLAAHEAAASEQSFTASRQLSELEAKSADELRRQRAAYVQIFDDRSSWRKQALDEKGGAQAAAAALQRALAVHLVAPRAPAKRAPLRPSRERAKPPRA